MWCAGSEAIVPGESQALQHGEMVVAGVSIPDLSFMLTSDIGFDRS